MPNASSNHMRLPWPYRAEQQKEERWVPGDGRSPSAPGGSKDFVSPSSSRLTGWRLGALMIVLACVTLSMLMSFLLLFAGNTLHLLLASLTLPLSWSALGLMSIGGCVGMPLWITLSTLFKRKPRIRLTYGHAALSGTSLGPARAAFFPEAPGDRPGELFSSDFESKRAQWFASAWDGKPRKQTDRLALRQRSRSLRLYYAGNAPDVPGRARHYQIRKVNGRIFFQRKTQ